MKKKKTAVGAVGPKMLGEYQLASNSPFSRSPTKPMPPNATSQKKTKQSF